MKRPISQNVCGVVVTLTPSVLSCNTCSQNVDHTYRNVIHKPCHRPVSYEARTRIETRYGTCHFSKKEETLRLVYIQSFFFTLYNVDVNYIVDYDLRLRRGVDYFYLDQQGS